MNKINFILLNILLSSNILKYPLFFLGFWLVATEHPLLFKSFLNEFFLSCLIVFGVPIAIVFFYWLFKIYIFILLFKKSKIESFSHKFFEKFQNDDKFQENILIKAMFLDIFFFLFEAGILYFLDMQNNMLFGKIYIDYAIRIGLCCFVCGTGVFISYYALSVWIDKQRNTSVKDQFDL